MARITENQLDTLKSDISLARLIESQGCKITKQGKDHIMNCPFHDDKTPSLNISTDKNVFNCFGCGASGTIIDWVMKTQNLDFRAACENLMKYSGMELDEEIDKNDEPASFTPDILPSTASRPAEAVQNCSRQFGSYNISKQKLLNQCNEEGGRVI